MSDNRDRFAPWITELSAQTPRRNHERINSLFYIDSVHLPPASFSRYRHDHDRHDYLDRHDHDREQNVST